MVPDHRWPITAAVPALLRSVATIDGGIGIREIVAREQLERPPADAAARVDLLDRQLGSELHRCADGIGEGARESMPNRPRLRSGAATRKRDAERERSEREHAGRSAQRPTGSVRHCGEVYAQKVYKVRRTPERRQCPRCSIGPTGRLTRRSTCTASPCSRRSHGRSSFSRCRPRPAPVGWSGLSPDAGRGGGGAPDPDAHPDPAQDAARERSGRRGLRARGIRGELCGAATMNGRLRGEPARGPRRRARARPRARPRPPCSRRPPAR